MLTYKNRCPHCGWRETEVCNYPFDNDGSKYRAWCPKCENAFELCEPKSEYEDQD